MKKIRITLVTISSMEQNPLPEPFTPKITLTELHYGPHSFVDQIHDDDQEIVVINTEHVDSARFAAIDMLVRKTPFTRIVILCPQLTADQVRAVISIGVTGVLLHHDMNENFYDLAHLILRGKIVLSRSLMQDLVLEPT